MNPWGAGIAVLGIALLVVGMKGTQHTFTTLLGAHPAAAEGSGSAAGEGGGGNLGYLTPKDSRRQFQTNG